MEEFFASQDAITLDLNDIPKQPPIEWSTGAWNGPIQRLSNDDPFGDLDRFIKGVPNAHMCVETEPITLSGLMKIKDEMDARFPEPLKFRHGADMSHETFVLLGIPMASKDEEKTWMDIHKARICSIEIHIVPSVPFGKVEECRCSQRKDYIDALEFKENV